MLNAARRRFGTIRWKLAGSYVLVSLLIALFGELLLVAGLLYLFNSRLITNAFQANASRYAAVLRTDYLATDDREAKLAAKLTELLQKETQQPVSEPAMNLTFGSTSVSVSTILVDARGVILAANPRGDYQPGSLLAPAEPPLVYAFVTRALSGITETQQLSGWVGSDRQLVAAAPVFGPSEQVIGAVLVRSEPLPLVDILGGVGLSLMLFLAPVLVISSLLGLVYGWFAGRGFSRRLTRLTSANAALAAGDLTPRVDDQSADEIGQLGRQFNLMADRLAENLRALRRLADQNAQLAEQAGHLAMIEERNRLARDLHDSVSQELFSLAMLSAAARRQIDKQPQLAAQQLDEIQSMAQRALQETRSLIFALRPAALGDRGLAPALRDLVASAQQRQGLVIELEIQGERRLPLEYEQTLFRITQEALANVARHSGVHAAEVALRYADDAVELIVADRGRGFDMAAQRSARSIGLHSIAERAAALGGQAQVGSAPGQGTTVTVLLPVADEVKRLSQAVPIGSGVAAPEHVPK